MDLNMTRIELLHRGPLKEKNLNLGFEHLYQQGSLLNIDYIPFTLPENHTMSEALDPYIIQKLPTEFILKTAKHGGSLEVHGIYPKHFEFQYAQDLQNGNLLELNFYHRPTTRIYNVVRPRFFIGKNFERFIVCVPPGPDYIKHYGTMVRHLVIRNDLKNNVKLLYYPIAYHTLPFWTGLHNGFIYKKDRVILGYVNEVYNEISSSIDLIPVSTSSSPYIESRRYRLPSGSIINFLGVNFSFWGDLSKIISESICQSGANEIIYAGKLGSMTTPDSLYKDLFSPTEYYTLSHKNIVNHVQNLKNGLVNMYPELNSGCHVSVPTVLEEDYIQRSISEEINANSIDNEISQMIVSI